ncbi:MAG: winged helix-turn-helix domain-containing protein [Brevirhabdus sp.]
MAEPKQITLRVRGDFSIESASGDVLTPKGRKECALLAMLALSPERQLSRRILQDTLWPDRFSDQAQASLRRALSNIRKSLGEYRALLLTSPKSVSLHADAKVAFDRDQSPSAQLLEGMDPKCDPFDSWLQSVRSMDIGHDLLEAPAIRRHTNKLRVNIDVSKNTHAPDIAFVDRYVADTLAKRYTSLGSLDVRILTEPETTNTRDTVATVRLNSSVSENRWYALAELVGQKTGSISWAGRLDLNMRLAEIWDNPKVSNFAGQIAQATVDRCTQERTSSSFSRTQRAARRLFSGNFAEIRRAGIELEHLAEHDRSGVVLIWKAFHRLTEILESGEADPADSEEALALADEAMQRSSHNPLVWALAAHIRLKLTGDAEFAGYLARKAIEFCDQNPYALNSLSHTAMFNEKPQVAYDTAQKAHACAQHLPNVFYWDMQCGLAALRMGEVPEALGAFSTAYMKAPSYRPALRYLLALHALNGDQRQITNLTGKLEELEPGFTMKRYLSSGYPLDTLRSAGLFDELSNVLA